MKKRGVIFPFVFTILISFASAYNYENSLGDLLNHVDSSLFLLGAVFIICFALLNFALSRTFKDKNGEPNKSTAGVIAFALSALIIYWINKADFNLEDFFYNFGLSSEILFVAVPVIILVGVIYMFVKLGIKTSFLIFGAVLIFLSFTDIFVEKTILFVVGLILVLLGFFIKTKGKKKIDFAKILKILPKKSRKKLISALEKNN